VIKPHDFFQYKNGELFAENVACSEIAKEVGTPVYIYSSSAFLKPLRALQVAVPGGSFCFAVKSNSNLAVLSLLNRAGAGADIVSGGELYRCKLAGFPGERIVFSGVGKTADEMKAALTYGENGIHSFNVESEPELERLSDVASSLGKVATVALRYNPDVDPETHPYISTGLREDKFGLSLEPLLAAAKRAEELPGINLKGISIHIGSQILKISPKREAFEKVRSLVIQLNKTLKEPLEFVDLGGGVGIQYLEETPMSLEEYGKLVHESFSDLELDLFFEPGRFISGNAGIFLTEIQYRKSTPDKDFLVVDGAMNDLIRPALYESYHHVVPVTESHQKADLKPTDVVGPVCESGDFFAQMRALSTDLKQGDLVALLSAGAYGAVMSSQYNSRPRAPEVLVEGDRFTVVRRRETLEDLVEAELKNEIGGHA
jgi:diaminopimelate decarboxylase